MYHLICVMRVYNCADVILESLKSIDEKVDEIRCYDGRWIGHDGSDYSVDDTEEVIRKFAEESISKVTYKRFPPMYEWQFHNEVLKEIDNGDWVFKLDSDEIITEWGMEVFETLIHSEAKAYRVCWGMYKPYAAVPNAKFYKKTPHLHYNENHREIFDETGWIDTVRAPIIHIVYDHIEKAMTKKDRLAMSEYERRNHEYEASKRREMP